MKSGLGVLPGPIDLKKQVRIALVKFPQCNLILGGYF